MLSFRKTLLTFGLLTVLPFAEATPIVLDGDRFSVTYDDTQVGVYRQGQLSGSLDTIYFLPTAFTVASSGAPVTRQAGLQFTLSIDPGYVFDGLSFAENGNYFLSNAGLVGASASLQALDLDTLGLTALNMDSGQTLVQAGRTASWGLSGTLGPQALDGAQLLQISLDTRLSGEPVQGLGFIQSTYVGFRVQTRAQAVPEPSALALMMVGAVAAAGAGRRLRRARHAP